MGEPRQNAGMLGLGDLDVGLNAHQVRNTVQMFEERHRRFEEEQARQAARQFGPIGAAAQNAVQGAANAFNQALNLNADLVDAAAEVVGEVAHRAGEAVNLPEPVNQVLETAAESTVQAGARITVATQLLNWVTANYAGSLPTTGQVIAAMATRGLTARNVALTTLATASIMTFRGQTATLPQGLLANQTLQKDLVEKEAERDVTAFTLGRGGPRGLGPRIRVPDWLRGEAPARQDEPLMLPAPPPTMLRTSPPPAWEGPPSEQQDFRTAYPIGAPPMSVPPRVEGPPADQRVEINPPEFSKAVVPVEGTLKSGTPGNPFDLRPRVEAPQAGRFAVKKTFNYTPMPSAPVPQKQPLMLPAPVRLALPAPPAATPAPPQPPPTTSTNNVAPAGPSLATAAGGGGDPPATATTGFDCDCEQMVPTAFLLAAGLSYIKAF